MANIKSAIKRISVTKTKQALNRPVKSNLANEIKKFQNAVEAGELKHAEAQLSEVFAVLDAAAADHVIHKNKADRKKSQLATLLHQKQQQKKSAKKAAPKAEATPAETPVEAKAAKPETPKAATKTESAEAPKKSE